MEEGAIEVDSIEPIGFPDITPELARESGFLGVLDLLKVAKHGRGENIYLIRFHYVRPRGKRKGGVRLGRTSNGFCVVLSWLKSGVGTTVPGHPTARPLTYFHEPFVYFSSGGKGPE
jgi:hypothetical protein